jgi:hypothetical protein
MLSESIASQSTDPSSTAMTIPLPYSTPYNDNRNVNENGAIAKTITLRYFQCPKQIPLYTLTL